MRQAEAPAPPKTCKTLQATRTAQGGAGVSEKLAKLTNGDARSRVVGRTPSSARDPLVPLVRRQYKFATGRRGRRPRTRGSAPPGKTIQGVRATSLRRSTAYLILQVPFRLPEITARTSAGLRSSSADRSS